MSKKPSLFVVERKEVFILGILFLLSIVLTFTVGVKYGEIVGRKAAIEEITAEEGLREAKSNRGGSLGEQTDKAKMAESDAHSENKPAAGHSSDQGDKHTDDHSAKDASHEDAHAEGTHAESDAHEGEAHSDGAAQTASDQAHSGAASPSKGGTQVEVRGSVKDSDAELLEALQKAGIEKRTDDSAAPSLAEAEEMAEKAPDFTGPHFVIQVGSYPTKRDAERHIQRLQAQKLDPRILPSAETKSGRWFRVALGQYESRNVALQNARSYKKKGLIEDYFVRKVQ